MQLDCSTKRLGQTGELVSECGRMCLLGSKESNDPEGVAHVSQGFTLKFTLKGEAPGIVEEKSAMRPDCAN